jgi:hypothetical protein
MRDVEMTGIAKATIEPEEQKEVEITPEMITAGRLAFDAFSMVDLYKSITRVQSVARVRDGVGSQASSTM